MDEAKEIGGNIMGSIGLWLSSLDLPMQIEIESHADAWLSLHPMAEPILAGKKVVAVTV